MAKTSRLKLARHHILSHFSEVSQKVYSQAQLANVLRENRHSWRVASHTTPADFISFLMKDGDLRVHQFRSEAYGKQINRYSWGKASSLALALSIKKHAYLCHATAAMVHGLLKLSQKTIYLNAEQSAKWSDHTPLTQEGIDRAFSRPQRQSNLVYICDRTSVVMISGKNTNRLGVEEIVAPTSEIVSVTNLERTLVDIVVRPTYAGGISQVFKVYGAAKDRVSCQRLLDTLKKLEHRYPYHQAIGFLMQKAGYPEECFAQLRALGLNHDFYLDHSMREPKYSKDWRLFYPKELKMRSRSH
jgi:predicted transcriptional regulator of viral defense system